MSLSAWLFAHIPSMLASRVMFVGVTHSTTFVQGVGVPFAPNATDPSPPTVA